MAQQGGGRLRRPGPLVHLGHTGAGPGLVQVFHGEDAIADGEALKREIHEGAGTFARHDVVVPGLAADDSTQRHIGVELQLLLGDGDGAGDFQRARHGNPRPVDASGLQRGDGALGQFVGEVVIEAGLDDEHVALQPAGVFGFLVGLHAVNSVRRAA